MPDIVSNTTPIISLLKLDKLDLFKQLYNRVNIPLAVFKEIESGKSKEYYKDLSQLDWIKIIEVSNNKAVKDFFDLDAGEAEAIVLAKEINSELIIMDEKLGRYYAKKSNLKITGTIGILIKAKNLGLIDKLKPLLTELTEKQVWISDGLKNEILKKVGEE